MLSLYLKLKINTASCGFVRKSNLRSAVCHGVFRVWVWYLESRVARDILWVEIRGLATKLNDINTLLISGNIMAIELHPQLVSHWWHFCITDV